MKSKKNLIVKIIMAVASFAAAIFFWKYYNGLLYKLLLSVILGDTVKSIDAKDIPSDAIVLDTREESEYSISHIEDAMSVGYNDFDISVVDGIEKNKPIVVYCSIGYRSEKIGEQLQEAGFTNVSNLNGGLFQWVNDDKAIVNNKDEPTDSVHAFSKTWGVWLNKGEKVY